MIFESVLNIMKNPNKLALDKSLADCHAKGIFSLVIDGGIDDETGEIEHGTLTRVFIATKKVRPFDIQFHSHRYSLSLGVISGGFTHHLATQVKDDKLEQGNAMMLKRFEYRSPLNGGNGLTLDGEFIYKTKSYDVPVGAELYLPSDLIHTVSCTKGTIWFVKERGFVTDSSIVLGVPFQTEGLYNAPKQYQVNDMYTLVLKHLKSIVGDV